jgi:hypothetical protein
MMAQTETNAALEPGLEVNFVSSDGAIWDATITRLHGHEYCDLNIYPGLYPMTPLYQIPYDSNGGLHSWHKKSDGVEVQNGSS